MRRNDAPSADDRLVLLTRLCFTPLALVTLIFGPILLLFPGSTDSYWAWTIHPDMSVTWIGSAYTFGALALATMLVRGRWTSTLVPVASTLPFAVVMLAATLIHHDRFALGTFRYYVWLAIYIILPVVLPAILVLNSGHAVPAAAGELMLSRRVGALLVTAGVAAAVLGLVLVLRPTSLRGAWPWMLTPLMGQVIGGWMLFLATGGLAPLVERRYAAYRYYLPSAVAWFVILLVASLVHRGDFGWHRASTYVYFVAVCGAIAALVAVMGVMERRLNASRPA